MNKSAFLYQGTSLGASLNEPLTFTYIVIGIAFLVLAFAIIVTSNMFRAGFFGQPFGVPPRWFAWIGILVGSFILYPMTNVYTLQSYASVGFAVAFVLWGSFPWARWVPMGTGPRDNGLPALGWEKELEDICDVGGIRNDALCMFVRQMVLLPLLFIPAWFLRVYWPLLYVPVFCLSIVSSYVIGERILRVDNGPNRGHDADLYIGVIWFLMILSFRF